MFPSLGFQGLGLRDKGLWLRVRCGAVIGPKEPVAHCRSHSTNHIAVFHPSPQNHGILPNDSVNYSG
jgi:hypothetical protein